MRGKHRRTAERRDAARMAELQASYDERLRTQGAAFEAEEASLRLQIETMSDNREHHVERLAQQACDAARSATEAAERAAERDRQALIALVLDVLFSTDANDEPWDPAPAQLQMAADALGIPVSAMHHIEEATHGQG
jgi:sugar (pentulose or hexulose) kinase